MQLLNSIKHVLTTPRNAYAYLARAHSRYLKGNYPGAIADYNQAVQMGIMPDFKICGARGIAYFNIGDMKAAIADLSTALLLEPTVLSTQQIRGCAYQREGQYDFAIADFTEILKRSSDNFEGYLERGRAYFSTKQYGFAAADLSRAISLKPEEYEP